MQVIDYIKQNGINKLISEFNININIHKKYPNLYCINYDQIESPVNNITSECRGLILDLGIPNNPLIISRGYNRFFNYGESRAVTINWHTAKVYSKVDGSYCSLYWYDGEWKVSTRGTPDASGEVNGWPITFSELFWRTWDELNYSLPHNKEWNYLFELCTKENKVVCQWKEPHIILHGIRNRVTQEEYDITALVNDNNKYNNWEVVKTHNLSSFEDIVKACEQLNPMQDEGFVVCDAQFNRVKIKSLKYIALGNLRDGHGPKRIIQIIRDGGMEEFLTYFPEWKEEYEKYNQKYQGLIVGLESIYEQFKDEPDQKTFALNIKDYAFNGALFMMRAGKIKSVREYLQNININNLVEYFK